MKLLVCFLLMAVSISATSVVAVRTELVVIIGADSKTTSPDGSTTFPPMCKVGFVNNTIWGYARLLENQRLGYSLEEITKATMSGPGDMIQRLSIFAKRVQAGILPILKEEKASAPQWFATKQEGWPAVQIAFGAFENGLVNLYERDFIPHSTANGGLSIEVKMADHLEHSRKLFWVALGYNPDVAKELESNPDALKVSLADSIRRLINIEIQADPSEVGLPISIIRPNANGVSWIDKGLCK